MENYNRDKAFSFHCNGTCTHSLNVRTLIDIFLKGEDSQQKLVEEKWKKGKSKYNVNKVGRFQRPPEKDFAPMVKEGRQQTETRYV